MPPSQHIHLVDFCFWRNRHFPPGRHIPINYCNTLLTHHSYPGSTTLACYQVSVVFCTLFFALLSYYSTSINCTSHTKLHAVYINTLFFSHFCLITAQVSIALFTQNYMLSISTYYLSIYVPSSILQNANSYALYHPYYKLL